MNKINKLFKILLIRNITILYSYFRNIKGKLNKKVIYVSKKSNLILNSALRKRRRKKFN